MTQRDQTNSPEPPYSWIEVQGPCEVVTPSGLKYHIESVVSLKVPLGSYVEQLEVDDCVGDDA